MRTKLEIQQDYVNVCAALGDITFRIAAFQEEADRMHNRLHNLNVEQAKADKAGIEVSLPDSADDAQVVS